MKDLTNQRFSRLTVIKYTEKRQNGSVIWLCKCDCGNFKEAKTHELNRHGVQSCGCLHREITSKRLRSRRGKLNASYKHGESHPKTKLYYIWVGIKQRCFNPKSREYKYYGKRGIIVCSEWRNNYLIFKTWALANGYQEGLTIDRIDNNGNYEPSNCQFITRSENVGKSNRTRILRDFRRLMG